MDHECTHEEDWKTVNQFMGAKEATNGALKDKDTSLEGRLNAIDAKLDKFILAMLVSSFSAIFSLIVAIIALIR